MKKRGGGLVVHSKNAESEENCPLRQGVHEKNDFFGMDRNKFKPELFRFCFGLFSKLKNVGLFRCFELFTKKT
jgi:hypothetical protein